VLLWFDPCALIGPQGTLNAGAFNLIGVPAQADYGPALSVALLQARIDNMDLTQQNPVANPLAPPPGGNVNDGYQTGGGILGGTANLTCDPFFIQFSPISGGHGNATVTKLPGE
jgi:hypothetical protein